MMRLAAAFPHAMPVERAEETRKTRFLSGLRPNLKSTLAWEMCLDGGSWQMTYEEIKDMASCRLSKGKILPRPMTRLLERMQLLPRGMMDNGIEADNLTVIRLVPSTGAR